MVLGLAMKDARHAGSVQERPHTALRGLAKNGRFLLQLTVELQMLLMDCKKGCKEFQEGYQGESKRLSRSESEHRAGIRKACTVKKRNLITKSMAILSKGMEKTLKGTGLHGLQVTGILKHFLLILSKMPTPF